MRVGIDLDNTIISYDRLFVQLASERFLIPSGFPPNKQAIRDHLRAQGQEDRWTELQGLAYGSRIDEAVMFDGVQDFFQKCHAAGVDWIIISHRSLVPYLGEPVDLHAAALGWLVKQKLIRRDQLERVQLEVTREAKLQRIRESQCDVFIDDLPELLADPAFPPGIRRILFDPASQNRDNADYECARSWYEISSWLGISHRRPLS
jgi:hypothetical protein